MTEISCFLSRSAEPVHERHRIWSEPFPLHRDAGPGGDPVQPAVTYGDYFSAVRAFLAKDAFRCVTRSIHLKTKTAVRPRDIQSIGIHLEKHGEFYHPARVVVRCSGKVHLFVLNAAISPAGMTAVRREYALLKRLRETFPWRYTPAAYALDAVSVQDGKRAVALFLGEWFEGYCEFHLSGCRTAGKTGIVLWRESGDRSTLAAHMVYPLFRKAAEILTCYYNVSSFKQICSWHHAAGDFITSVSGDRLDVKLISVRNYAPITDNARTDPETMVQSMLIFLVNLSLRMRVDRIDGTGDLIWADERAVAGCVRGFVDGMSRQARIDPLAEPLSVLFRTYAGNCTPGDLVDIAAALVNAYHPDAPETGLIRKHLSAHCAALHETLKGVFP